MKDNFCFFVIDNTAHLEYLEPYILLHPNKECLVLISKNSLKNTFEKLFPHLNLIIVHTSEVNRIEEYLLRFPIHFFACFHEIHLKKDLLKRFLLDKNYVSVYVKHGLCQKTPLNYLRLDLKADITTLYGDKEVDQIRILCDLKDIPSNSNFKISSKEKTTLFYLLGNQKIKKHLQKEIPLQKEKTNSKINILYLPTFDAYNAPKSFSSIHFFNNLIREFSCTNKYKFIVKLHPNTHLENPSYIKLLENLKSDLNLDMIITSEESYFSYMEITDLIVSDRTSSIYDCLYFDKPIIFLDHLNKSPCSFSKNIRDGILNDYWVFQAGNIIREKDILKGEEILKKALAKDPFSSKRQEVKNYAFKELTTPRQVIELAQNHPNLQKQQHLLANS
jgi:hypothetical protein